MSDGAGEDFPFEEFLNLSSDDEPQPPHFPSSSSPGYSKRQRTSHDYVAVPPPPTFVFQETVDSVIRLSAPLPFHVSQGTLKGTAAAMDQLSAHAQLYQLLSPPYGNFHWFCQLSLLIHRIKGFLMSAPTANACGFIETGEKGWRYRCNSKVCQPQPCPVLKENVSSHLLLLLLQFVEAMVRNPTVVESSQIAAQLEVSTQCHLANLGPYSLTIPLELSKKLGSFIMSLRQPIIHTPSWPDLSTRTPLRQRPVFSKGSEDQLDMEALDKFLHPELETGNHVAILFYCENYTHYRNNEFCQNDIKALSLTLQSFFGYEVTACCVEQSQEVIIKLENTLSNLQPDRDVVFVYFSCHGTADSLLFTEAHPEAMGVMPTSSFLKLTELLEFLLVYQIHNLTVFYDCCRNASPDAAQRGSQEFHPSPTLPGLFQIHPASGFPAYESSMLGSSLTVKGEQHWYKGHGFFTWCLLKALCWLCSKNSTETGPIQSSTLFTCLVYWQASFQKTQQALGLGSIARVPLQQTSQGSVVYFSKSSRTQLESAAFPILARVDQVSTGPIYVVWLVGGLQWFMLVTSVFGSLGCDVLVSLEILHGCHNLLDRFLFLCWLILTIAFAFRAEMIWLPILDFRTRKPVLEDLKLCRDELRKKNLFQNFALHQFSVLCSEIEMYGNQLKNKRLSLWASVQRYLRLDLKTADLNQVDELVAACEGMIETTTPHKYVNRDALIVVGCAAVCLHFFLKI